MSDQLTVARPARMGAGPDRVHRSLVWNGGAELGLLLLRLAMNGPILANVLQKVLGLVGGQAPAGFVRALEVYGLTSSMLLSWVTGVTELVGGVLLVLGLVTPLAATGMLALLLDALLLKVGAPFFPGAAGLGWELSVVFGLATAAIVLADRAGSRWTAGGPGTGGRSRGVSCAWLSVRRRTRLEDRGEEVT